ncbi:MAG: glycyl-radical enzyme activating protein, partial [Oscillospiraceae bacterium]|nr:glycyl-radical enzyme activating protein [Oscillospiraceae bacterium]
MANGMIFDIEHGSFVDGPGLRTTVFFKGCNLQCAWCHNPESQSARPVRMYYADKCVHCGRCIAVCPSPDQCILCGKCAAVCPRSAVQLKGQLYTADQVMEEILLDRDFYGDDGGITFSGGECMLQPDFLMELLLRCKSEGIHTAVDTAGNCPFSLFERILPFTDLFLYDVKIMNDGLHQKWTGAGNEQILSNLAKLLRMGMPVWVRVPVIPGVNDTVEEITALREFFLQNGRPERIELLPYHRLGENK